MSIGLALSSSATSQSPAVPAPSEQLFRLVWDDDRRREFFSALELDDVVLDLLAQAQAATLSSDTLGLSVQLLGQALFHAARVVGMNHSLPRFRIELRLRPVGLAHVRFLRL